MIRLYGYNKCTTCQRAKRYLVAKGLSFDEVDITTTPPPKALLRSILQSGRYPLKNLFNRSGQRYRALNIKQKLRTMSEAQALDLLAREGKLLKRPVITDGKKSTVGFDEAEFRKIWV